MSISEQTIDRASTIQTELWNCNSIFFRLHLYTLSKTLIACRDMQLRFLKVKILLNKAFKSYLMFPTRIMHVSFYNLLLRILRSNALTSAHKSCTRGRYQFLIRSCSYTCSGQYPINYSHESGGGSIPHSQDEIARELFEIEPQFFFNIKGIV